MAEIIPVINSKTFEEVRDKIRKVEPYAKWAHIDVADGTFAPITLWHNSLDLVGFKTNLNLEIHMMENDPEERIDHWFLPPVKRIIVHWETVNDMEFIIEAVNKYKSYEEILTELVFIGDDIRDKQKKSFVLSVAKFLEAWLGSDIGYGRILSKEIIDKKLKVTLSYRCLDPSLAAKEVIEKSYSTILMSGTLTPTSMYRDLLGFKDNVIEKEYKSPFPKKNRLNLIIPKTTTKFAERSHRQYGEIAGICADIVNLVNGNSAIFFPSYDLMLNVNESLSKFSKKPIFIEKQSHGKREKEELLSAFKGYKDKGAVLLGTSTGSFGEGIDMPGVLKTVIIVGLPLNKPDVEAKLLIEYYDDKFGRGFEYGYVLPAITKCLQNAGRCIRSETDKGAIIFLDERYAWRNYYSCFPEEWDMEVSLDYESALKGFFGK